jgi:hypothetical protein
MFINSEFLEKVRAVDKTPRDIKNSDNIELYCHSCDNKTIRDMIAVKTSVRKCGYGYQCDECLNKKYILRSSNPEWKEKIKKAANTEESKERSRENGRKKIAKKNLKNVLDYWDFPNNDIKETPGHTQITGICKACKSENNKQLKKFIEGSVSRFGGCLNCFSAYTKTDEYKKEMSDRPNLMGQDSRDKQANSLREHMNSLTEDERKQIYGREVDIEVARENMRKRWENDRENMTRIMAEVNRRPEKIEKQREAVIATMSNFSDEKKAAIQAKIEQTMLEKYGVRNPALHPEIRRKILAKQGMTSPEKYIFEMLSMRGITFEYQHNLNGKFWDFGVFNENGELSLIIEIDGEFHHALRCDAFYKHQGGHSDNERFSRVPYGVKYLEIDSEKIKEAPKLIIDTLGLDYDEWIDSIFHECSVKSFPYPEYTNERMLKDWENLKRITNLDDYNYSQIPCNSIMTHFHKSVYHCHCKNKPSPFKAWHDPDLLYECIKNRFVYKSTLSTQQIARGFEKNKIAPRVSLFQPSLVRYLLSKYAPEAKTVVDPFSGFSGRMLGTVSLGLSYTGYDINETSVKESNEIIKFLDIGDLAKISCQSVEDYDSDVVYDVLLTCPPYGNKEIWEEGKSYNDADYYIEQCLNRVKANVYIFVVDKTVRFKDFLKDSVKKRTYLSSSNESILIVDGNLSNS